MDKVTVERVPVTKERIGVKRWEEERGAFVQISYHEEIRHLVLFEIRKGFTRGNHYHIQKEEIFYIAQGKIKATFLDMDSRQRAEHLFGKGDKIRIRPRCGHLFYGLEDALVVEYSPQRYESEDSYPIEL
jgi:dTDP-4-dehydrorhamnose 3,5-epimerase-like enzyme